MSTPVMHAKPVNNAGTTREVYRRNLLQRIADAVGGFGGTALGWLRNNPVLTYGRKAFGWLRSLFGRGRALAGTAYRQVTYYVPAPLLALKALTSRSIVTALFHATDVVINTTTDLFMRAARIVTWPLTLLGKGGRKVRDNVLEGAMFATVCIEQGYTAVSAPVFRYYLRLESMLAFKAVSHLATGAVIGTALARITGLTPVGIAVGIGIALLSGQTDWQLAKELKNDQNSWVDVITTNLGGIVDYLEDERRRDVAAHATGIADAGTVDLTRPPRSGKRGKNRGKATSNGVGPHVANTAAIATAGAPATT